MELNSCAWADHTDYSLKIEGGNCKKNQLDRIDLENSRHFKFAFIYG